MFMSKTINELIADRDRIDRLIDEMIREQKEELATCCECDEYGITPEDIRDLKLLNKNDRGGFGSFSVRVNVNIDNSVKTITSDNSYRNTKVDTTLTVGDAAISAIGGILGGLFK